MANYPSVAYFCMEFGLHESLKIYAGGLGILAGDVLKAAKDADYPMVGVGILWRQGYVSQRMDRFGRPYDSFYEYRYPFLEDTGVIVEVEVRRRPLKLKVWKCTEFGNADLYLLDAFVKGNEDMLITGQLYGWFEEERLAQEIILGIGGIRALKALGINPDIYHFNDSHPVIGSFELIKEKMDKGLSFEEAVALVRKKIVFTTHTPVRHGNEKYSYEALEYMGVGREFTRSQLESIGGDPFSMTVAGLRMSRVANAVSQLHGQTAKEMWGHIEEANIIAISNGVHRSWQDDRIAKAKGDALWNRHLELKRRLFVEIERRSADVLDEDILTIGSARRAAPYKRSDLIFRHTEEIMMLLESGKIQLVFSGKAHPNDIKGKAILANLYDRACTGRGVVFIENYDMEVGRLMVRGCDAWLNTPARPMEASGTSGMKAAMNGVLNISILDGWWPEACEHCMNGWQIGGGYQGSDADEVDAASLLDTLKNQIIPCYYDDRDRWVNMMKQSIDSVSVSFSAARMLDEYYEKMYMKK
ncbi:MAG: alpha-glucan family phosphorylase [Christensenellales bacterium]|jgi:starch phosphorylase